MRIAFSLLAIAMICGQATSQQVSRADSDLFEIHVRPTITRHCLQCHNKDKHEGGLRLTSLSEIMSGGDSGPAIDVGNPNESLLIQALRYESLEMPPEEPLNEDLVIGLATWISAGAPWPDGVVLQPLPKITDGDRDWWCFQNVRSPSVPAADNEWCRTDIDRFIWDRLAKENLQPARETSALVLVRRVHFTLTGLPPSSEMIDAAMSPSFNYESFVDDLLQSKAYGENQARHWLDLVRYADTDGYRADHSRPEARHYRDYVIRAFNDDKPYDQFIREQLAGDEIAPGNRDAHIATMYLRHWIYEHNQRDVETQWHEILNDITETTSDVFLAQGLKCARCHDHKFDPLLQKDYFRFKAFFAAFQPTETHPIADAQTRAEHQRKLAKWEVETESLRRRLHEIEHPVLLKHATREGFDKFIPKIKSMIRKWPADRDPYEQQIASLSKRQFDLPYDKLYEWLSDDQKDEHKRLKTELAAFDPLKPKTLPTMKFVGSDVGPVAPATFIPDQHDKGEIAPGYITLLDETDAVIEAPAESLRSTGRRTTLANWIASPDNPLTARVMVNRIWQQHFGRGLVETSSDFGHLGVPPTHPLLLDWLATQFVADQWSIKKLHRHILLSATYRQTSRRPPDQAIQKIDPNNHLLWRMNPRRLTGEEINDSVLTASGELLKKKRAIYQPFKRNSPDALLAAFDSPDRIRSVGNRHRTTTSPQALLLSNSSWSHDRATAIEHRFRDVDLQTLVEQSYRLLLGRAPSHHEALLASDFLRRYAANTPVEKAPEFQTLVSMPNTDGKAIDLQPGGAVSLHLESTDDLPNEDFTVDAIVMLRSLYKDASVRTIVAHWDGSKAHAGWSLGVTSAKSAYKPRNLILQLVGNTSDGEKLHYEVIASNLRPELNKPYYVAASIDIDDVSQAGITFYMQDLSTPGGKLHTAKAKHTVTKNIRGTGKLTIGGRSGSHQWDGLIDNIRIESKRRDLTQVAQAGSIAGLPDYVVDWQFEQEKEVGYDSSGSNHHATPNVKKPSVKNPLERARVAFVHALLNSNELIYVD